MHIIVFFIFIFKSVSKDCGYYSYCKVNEVDKPWKNHSKLNVKSQWGQPLALPLRIFGLISCINGISR